MNSPMPPDMIRFDSSYSQDPSNEIVSASVFSHEREEGQANEIFTSRSRLTNLNMHRPVLGGFSSKLDMHDPRFPDTWPPIQELTTNLTVFPVDLPGVVICEENAKVKNTKEAYHSYASRIKFLQEEATVEGITFNTASERDFWKFIKSITSNKRGSLFLMDNGDLRVVWDDDEDNLVGLQFLGNSLARYVIFKRRTEDGPVSRVAGSDTLKGVNAQIQTFELQTLLSV